MLVEAALARRVSHNPPLLRHPPERASILISDRRRLPVKGVEKSVCINFCTGR